jgi:branched-chain amino acid transport system substrate-binding protein
MKMQKYIGGMLAVFIITLSFAVCPFEARAQGQEVVFGMIDPLSGPFKDIGMETAWGLEFAIEQINAKGGLLGKPVKLIKYDSQFRPDVAVRQVRKAVLEDGVKVMFQLTGSAVGLAVSKLSKELNIIHVLSHTEADEITGSEFQPNTFRLGFNTSMHSATLAHYFASKPYKRYYLLNQDYSFGHAVSESFRKFFNKIKRPDAEIVGEDYHPIATKDFGPYITKALATKPDVVITGNFSVDLTGMIKQARALGLNAVMGTYYLENPTWIKQIGEGSLGAVVGECWLSTVKTKQNEELVKAYQAWFKKTYPNEASNYLVPTTAILTGVTSHFVAEAIKKSGSVEADKLIKTLEGMTFEGPTGKMTIRPCDHQVQMDGWIAVVQKDHPFKGVLDYPFIGEAMKIPVEKISVPPQETGNPRCK